MSYETVVLSGTYKTPGGDVAEGVVTIKALASVISDSEGNVVLSGTEVVRLDGAGSFSVELPASDDATLSPTGFGYRLSVRLGQAGVQRLDPFEFYLNVADAEVVDGKNHIHVADITPSEVLSVNDVKVVEVYKNLAVASAAAAAESAAQAAASRSTTEALLQQATVITGLTGEDAAVELLIKNPSATSAALNTAIDESVDVVDNGTVSPNVTLGGTRNGSAVASDVSGGILLNPGGVGYNNVIGGDGAATVGTTTPNTSQAGTGANQSVLGGYDNVAGQLSSKIISDHSYTEYGTGTSQGHNAIYGGAHHVIREAANFSAICGGQSNDVAGAYSLVTGNTNVLSDTADSALVFGNNNTVAGVGVLVGGASNANNAPYAFCHGQLNETPSAGHFSAALGQYALSRVRGQWTWAVGRFAVAGDAQRTAGTWTLQTTDATADQRLKPGGLAAYYNIPASTTVLVRADIVARGAGDAINAAWTITALVRRNATGNSVVVGTPTVVTHSNADGLPEPSIQAASSAGQVSVRVTGLAATTVNWNATVETTEVGNI